jgi:hypothetical protein
MPTKEFALFEHPQGASLQTPGSCGGRVGNPPEADAWHGALSFWFFFFRATKEKEQY